MYRSDLDGLLRRLQESRANAEIFTEWTGPGETWQAYLTFSEGQVTACQVQNSVEGRLLLTDGEAIHWLASLGDLIWQQVDVTPHRGSAAVVRDTQTILLQGSEVPRRLAQEEQEGLYALSRQQRRVFLLVDGKRSTERITAILCQPLNVIEDTLHELQSQGVIAVGELTGN